MQRHIITAVGPTTITVPGGTQITFESVPTVERRVATKQRRARGTGNQSSSDGPLRRHKKFAMYGRRVNDAADHKDRRVAGMYRRRPGKGDIRFGRRATDPLHFAPVVPRWGRREGDVTYHRPERRGPVSRFRHYYSSADPRIRALERRES